VTRAAVLELAAGLGLEAEEPDVTLDELRAADEAFLTNSIMGVMPLTKLDGETIGEVVGPVTRRLSNALLHRMATGE
jgi:branched-subunit amino acid aminotransferase/4-amino-4-deoxychorismate lyase